MEGQLDSIISPGAAETGGYIVLHQTEALVAIDVNSAKQHERHIEETAIRTNLKPLKRLLGNCDYETWRG